MIALIIAKGNVEGLAQDMFQMTRGCVAWQINLVDWLKQMVGNRRSEEVADPSMEVKPTSRALKRALLVALRCVDPDALKRPKMGHVVHMLEAEEFPFRDVCNILSSSLSPLT